MFCDDIGINRMDLVTDVTVTDKIAVQVEYETRVNQHICTQHYILTHW